MRLRDQGTMRVVIDRGMQAGDQVVMDLEAVNAATGDAIEGIKQERFQLDTAAARINLPGLIDGLVGMKPGETKTFPLTMPNDWPQDFVRGITADFTVKLTELFDNEAGGLLRTSTRPTLRSSSPLLRASSVRMSMSIHLEWKSSGHVRSRFERLVSRTLPRGPRAY